MAWHLTFVLFLAFLSGQPSSKCGIIPENESEILRDNQNWGYGYDSLIIDLDRWNESPFVTVDSLGASVQNRGIWELIIAENPDLSTNHRIYIHSRTHPGEDESFWVTNEIINILLSDTPLGGFLRANFIFHIIPMFNPDGVELGYPRNNANGIDIESGWDDTPLEDQRCYFNEKNIAYTWDKSNPSSGDYPPGRLDFVFFTNSVMSVDKSFIISTEHMSESLLTENNL